MYRPAFLRIALAFMGWLVVGLGPMVMAASDDAKQAVIELRKSRELMLNKIYRGLPPLHDVDIAIHHLGRGANVDDRRNWREIDDDVVIFLAQPLNEVPELI